MENEARLQDDLDYLERFVKYLRGRYTIGYVAPVHDVVIAMQAYPGR